MSTDVMKLMSDTKLVVNSLLCTYQGGVPIKRLMRDYQDTEGKPLPFRQLGYASVEDFLRDVSDTAVLYWNNGEAIVKAVPNEKNARVLSLVSRQKSQNSRRGRGGRNGLSAYRYPNLPPRFGNVSYGRSEAPRAPPSIPADVQNRIRQLFAAHPSGLWGREFELAYRSRFNLTINFRNYGFPNLRDMLECMGDIVKICALGHDFRVEPVKGQIPERPPAPKPMQPLLAVNTAQCTLRIVKPVVSISIPEAAEESGISANLIIKIQQVLEHYSDGIWSSKFMLLFEEFHKQEFPLKKLGYNSVVLCMSALPSVVFIERPCAQDWKLYDARKPPQDDKSKDWEFPFVDMNATTQITTETIQNRVKAFMKKLLTEHPGGVPLAEIPQLYKKVSGFELNLGELDFKDLDEFIDSSLLQGIAYAASVTEDEILVFSASLTKAAVAKVIHERMHARQTVPLHPLLDAVREGGSYTMMSSSILQVTTLKVRVANIESIEEIYINLIGKAYTKALDILMDEMEDDYYGPSSMNYCMPEDLLFEGQLCAALYSVDMNWYRATIVSVKSHKEITVYYVDYGNTDVVNKEQLRLLHGDHLLLPVQAIKARLANLIPKRDLKIKGKFRLLELVKDKQLVSMNAHYSQEDVLSIFLTDTNSQADVHINDLLIEEGYAEMVQETYARPIFTPHLPTKLILGGYPKPLAELPSFDSENDENAELDNAMDKATPDTNKSIIDDDDIDDLPMGADHKSFQQTPKHIVVELPREPGPLVQSDNDDDEEDDGEEYYYMRSVKCVELLPNTSIHVINYDTVPFVLGTELSYLLFGEDILRLKLCRSRLMIPCVVVTRDERPELFVELVYYEVHGIMLPDGSERQNVSIYPLQKIPDMLKAFKKPPELIEGFERLLAEFNPEDPYWACADDEDADDPADMCPDEDLEQLQMIFTTKRKLLLKQSLRVDAMNCGDIVDQLNQVEAQLARIKIRLQEQGVVSIATDHKKEDTQDNLDEQLRKKLTTLLSRVGVKNTGENIPETASSSHVTAHNRHTQQASHVTDANRHIPHASHSTEQNTSPQQSSQPATAGRQQASQLHHQLPVNQKHHQETSAGQQPCSLVGQPQYASADQRKKVTPNVNIRAEGSIMSNTVAMNGHDAALKNDGDSGEAASVQVCRGRASPKGLTNQQMPFTDKSKGPLDDTTVPDGSSTTHARKGELNVIPSLLSSMPTRRPPLLPSPPFGMMGNACQLMDQLYPRPRPPYLPFHVHRAPFLPQYAMMDAYYFRYQPLSGWYPRPTPPPHILHRLLSMDRQWEPPFNRW